MAFLSMNRSISLRGLWDLAGCISIYHYIYPPKEQHAGRTSRLVLLYLHILDVFGDWPAAWLWSGNFPLPFFLDFEVDEHLYSLAFASTLPLFLLFFVSRSTILYLSWQGTCWLLCMAKSNAVSGGWNAPVSRYVPVDERWKPTSRLPKNDSSLYLFTPFSSPIPPSTTCHGWLGTYQKRIVQAPEPEEHKSHHWRLLTPLEGGRGSWGTTNEREKKPQPDPSLLPRQR